MDLSEKLLHFMDGCSAAFANAAPSIHPFDLLIGVAGAAALRLMVYFKGKMPRNTAKARNTAAPVGVHNFKCKGSLYGRTGGYAHD